MAEKHGEDVHETLFILPPDAHAERWTGRRMKPDEARELTGIQDIAYLSEFETRFHKAASAAARLELWTDIDRRSFVEADNESVEFTNRALKAYPALESHNLPVSYTHLDVYKRQAPVCDQAATPVNDQPKTSDKCGRVQTARRRCAPRWLRFGLGSPLCRRL